MTETGGESDESLLERAEAGLSNLTESLAEDEFDEAMTEVANLLAVADEFEDVVDAADVSHLPSAVDIEDVPDAVELEDLPSAISETDVGEVVDTSALVQAVELRELWGTTDVRELWTESRELQSALDKLDSAGDHGQDATVTDEVLDLTTDAVAAVGEEAGVEPEADGESTVGDEFTVPQETLQTQLQSQAMDAVDEFRRGMLAAHRELANVVSENRERTHRQREHGTSSRNPTAYRTLPAQSSRPEGQRSGTRYSTVPTETRYSTAPNRERVYGARFPGTRDSSDSAEDDR